MPREPEPGYLLLDGHGLLIILRLRLAENPLIKFIPALVEQAQTISKNGQCAEEDADGVAERSRISLE